MTGILFGKGRSFNPMLVAQIDHEGVACVNETALHVCGPRTAVICDRNMVLKLRDRIPAHVVWYIPDGLDILLDKECYKQTFKQIHPLDNWQDCTPYEAQVTGQCYCEGFSSTAALWYLWMIGCRTVHLSGVGDEGGYHYLFDGQPGTANQGERALAILQNVAKAFDLKLLKDGKVLDYES